MEEEEEVGEEWVSEGGVVSAVPVSSTLPALPSSWPADLQRSRWASSWGALLPLQTSPQTF